MWCCGRLRWKGLYIEGREQVLEAGKDVAMGSSPRASRREPSPADTLVLALWTPSQALASRLYDTTFVLSEPLDVGPFVTAATGGFHGRGLSLWRDLGAAGTLGVSPISTVLTGTQHMAPVGLALQESRRSRF